MENLIKTKMESLMKYVPFIDFVLEIDKQKYIKFINIRKWIVLRKKKYPLSDLNKIEQSIITQYKNLLLENNVQIPENITNIFAPMNFKQFVNLCSDEEEDDEVQPHINHKQEAAGVEPRNNIETKAEKVVNDSDDDLEIISIEPANNNKATTSSSREKETIKDLPEIDVESTNIFIKLDEIAEEDMKLKNLFHEPINYTYQAKEFISDNDDSDSSNASGKGIIYQRRIETPVLFKRRTDFKDGNQENETNGGVKVSATFVGENETGVQNIENKKLEDQNCTPKEISSCKDDEVEVQNLENKTNSLFSQKTITVITLDSGSDAEVTTDDERPTTSIAASKECKKSKNTDKLLAQIDAVLKDKPKERVANNATKSSKQVEPLLESLESVLLDIDDDMMDEIKDSPRIDAVNGSSKKENSILNKCTNNSKKTPNLSEEQIFKFIENISTDTDFNMGTFYEALSCLKKINISSLKTNESNFTFPIPVETPPPAPPTFSNPSDTTVLPPLLQQQHQQPATMYPVVNNNPNISYPLWPQQQQQQVSQIYPHNSHLTSTTCVAPPRPKLNINDPRIVKQLQAIQNSPLFSCNVLNPETADSIMKICQANQKRQPQQLQSNPQISSTRLHNVAPNNIKHAGTSNIITYGEYKRRQEEKRLELERKREEERKAQAEKTIELETQEMQTEKNKLMSILKPCEDQLKTLWSQQKDAQTNYLVNNNISEKQQGNPHKDIQQPPIDMVEKTSDRSKESKKKASKQRNSKKEHHKNQRKINAEEDRKLSRVFKNLNCTVIGFDQLNDYMPKSTSAEAVLDSDTSSNASQTVETSFVPRSIGLRRRSSIHALSAITKQLGQQSSDLSDSDVSQKVTGRIRTRRLTVSQNKTSSENLSQVGINSYPKRRKTIDEIIKPSKTTNALRIIDSNSDSSPVADCPKIRLTQNQNTSSENLSQVGINSYPKRRKTIDEIIEPTKTTNALRISDNDSDSSSKLRLTQNNTSCENLSQVDINSYPKHSKTINEIIKPTNPFSALRIVDNDSDSSVQLGRGKETPQIYKTNLSKNQLVIKLTRITPEYIKKFTKKCKEPEARIPVLKKNHEQIPSQHSGPAQRSTKLKRYNNDCQMTERNTSFCVLCKSKPSDLTNHYIGRHKTESYVSRLDWSELDDLQISTPFAILQPKTKNFRSDRYEAYCPFCKDKLLEPFMNLYPHFSAHTGEYAFQCSHCNLAKPYRPDIQSHILHSKTCRQATVQIMYRYPPNTQCIYLHYCIICNFVQLNEANVLKHLREHHDQSKAIPSNVEKCILAAISDSPDVHEAHKSLPPGTTPSPTPPSGEIPYTPGADNNDDNMLNVLELPGEENNATTTTTTVSNTNELNFKIDDDDIPVNNEPCLEDDFLEERQDKYSLEKQKTPPPPMTVIHTSVPSTPPSQATWSDRHSPMIIKVEHMKVEENVLMTPPRSAGFKANVKTTPVAKNQPAVYEKYRSYPPNVSYLGLYKCMIDDCYYSTECCEEWCKHTADHGSEESLQCPYCVIPVERAISIDQMIEHVRTQHEHLIYQCSCCCYRSCDASNVRIHQQTNHSSEFVSCKIYKSSDGDSKLNNKQSLNLNELAAKNIYKISCDLCSCSFYHTQLLVNHRISEHRVMQNANELKFYSCIYCPLRVINRNHMRTHIATRHPGELPCIYDHNTTFNLNEDIIAMSNIVDVSESVPYEEMANFAIVSAEVNNDMDIKPDLKQLLQHEEIIRVRLRKLTAHTGVAPDILFRCPEPTCGGFFSTFELWLKHIKLRHIALEYQCPHCPATKVLPLEYFAHHFQEHRSHIYLCFHCKTTCPNETMARQHATTQHADLGAMRFEPIRFSLSYSYAIMLQSTAFPERETFINELFIVLDGHLKDREFCEVQKLKHQWPVQENPLWLDDYLPRISNPVTRKCLIKDCAFSTTNEKVLFSHLRTSHVIKDTTFNCNKCNFSLAVYSNIDEVIDHISFHIKRDQIYITICTACSFNTISHQKMVRHIKEHHSARDVPLLRLFKSNGQVMMGVYIVFADNQLAFSTMKSCFCCAEKNMEGDVFSLHLKRYHKFSLNYFCEMCNFPLKSLKDVKGHFQQVHSLQKFKIRTELSSPFDLRVLALNVFQVEISTGVEAVSARVNIKSEHMNEINDDDDVIMLEENDIVIQESLKFEQPKEIPKLKCASFSKVLEPVAYSRPTISSELQPKGLQINQQPSTLAPSSLYSNCSSSTAFGTQISSHDLMQTGNYPIPNRVYCQSSSSMLPSTSVPRAFNTMTVQGYAPPINNVPNPSQQSYGRTVITVIPTTANPTYQNNPISFGQQHCNININQQIPTSQSNHIQIVPTVIHTTNSMNRTLIITSQNYNGIPIQSTQTNH